MCSFGGEAQGRCTTMTHPFDYAVCMLDPDGHVTTWNVGAQQLHGYADGEALGLHVSAFYPEEDVRAGKCEQQLAEAADRGWFADEGWQLRKDGKRFWAGLTITSIK